uniref:CLAVATA3/ESR (CLE)-related protein 18-like n=1 Tax=Nicotiana sylvestris TaxID=4096 RepID=A0A1U7VX79_NICSY|nr:PREDICTED: CLAVATA3/ESR (CLE)-related protein 18-like [Nicotiana sylvestris]
MELDKAKLVAIMSLMLFFPSSFCTSIDNEMKRLVPSGPDPMESPPTPFFKRHPSNIKKLYEFDILKKSNLLEENTLVEVVKKYGS